MLLALIAVLFCTSAYLLGWKRSGLRWFDHLVVRVSLVYCRVWHRWQSNRPAPFPLDRGCLIASNHTCSADPMYLLAGCAFPIGFAVAKEHFELNAFFRWVLTNICSVPVRRGGQDAVAARRILRVLEKGRNICIFPEGGLSGVLLGKPVPARNGIGYLALKSRAPVYPVFISGGPNTDELLPAWAFFTPKAAKVVFGPPIDLAAFYDRPITRKLIDEVTGLIMSRIRALDPKTKATKPLTPGPSI